jgi:flagellar hook-associated protein 1 FlgK
MSLSQALATAMSGLRASQASLAITSGNVANAETPGYVRKMPVQVATAAGGLAAGVRVDSINRQLDQYVQRQMRVESSGASYAGLRAQFYDRLQRLYGSPGSDSTLETLFNDFNTALQALSTSPDSTSARSAVLSAAQVLTQQLNSMTADVQGLRSDAELGLSDSVARANEAMQRIADINKQLGTSTANNATTVNLLDQRDRYIDELAQMMDINVIPNDHNQVTVFTNSGIQLVGISASTLAFDAKGSITAASQWSADSTKRAVGTLVLKGPNGADVDLVANHSIRSGQIAAYLEMRDQVLVQAQAQLDEIAGGLARALSDRTTDGSPAGTIPQTGFDVDLSGLQDGNTVHISYTDNTTGAQRSITLVRVDDPAALPLSNSFTADPNDKVVGLNFAAGMTSIVNQLTAALGPTALQFSNPSGNLLRVLDDGGINKVDVNAMSVTKTVTSLTSVTGGTAELPFFLDASNPFTGAIGSYGLQSVGLAGRLAVNAGLVADPSRLVVYQTSPLTASGDPTRPNFIYDRINNGLLAFSPQSGVGTTTAPFSGSLPSYMRQVISQQGEAAEAAANLKQGQDVVFNSLQERFNTTSAVNIDEEMATLLSLQNAYAANARVLTVVKEMIDTLLRM